MVDDATFLKVFRDEIERAMSRVTEQSENGENSFLPITAMWPHGEQDLLGIIFTKAARSVGYEMAGNLNKVVEEAQDILNYAGFLLAYIKVKEK